MTTEKGVGFRLSELMTVDAICARNLTLVSYFNCFEMNISLDLVALKENQRMNW
ncbi:hypothetical protein F511_41577 [Dorcoceras hygrometricum]|uniref:Uncharacterized protein n=1 Tax=Dorcoceras hygrometricum TaxID=472368 RepID=A0A2Z7C7K3_9LAMI|nr:hypothetical protein F511_41577 [Dorcoceras hygrometricum]